MSANHPATHREVHLLERVAVLLDAIEEVVTAIDNWQESSGGQDAVRELLQARDRARYWL